MNKISRTTTVNTTLKLKVSLINVLMDNYIEKEIFTNLYKLVNNVIDVRIKSIESLVHEMPSKDDTYREKVLYMLITEINREINYCKTITMYNKKEIKDSNPERPSVILYWVERARLVVEKSIPSYQDIIYNFYNEAYSMTGDNKLRIYLKIQNKRIINKFTTILELLEDDLYSKYFSSMYELYDVASEYVNCFNSKDSINSNLELNENDILVINEFKNVYDYKYLNKLAEKNDFIKVGQSGSHAQFKHSDGRLVTIPQGRDLGKGLSIKIQKDIITDRLLK